MFSFLLSGLWISIIFYVGFKFDQTVYQVRLAVGIVLCQFCSDPGGLFPDENVRRVDTPLQDFEASQLVKVVGL